MKIKLIFWGNETLALNRDGFVQDLKLAHYYKKVSSHLYEYVHINKDAISVLYCEVKEKSEITILVVLEKLKYEDLEVIKALQINCPNALYVFIKEINETLIKAYPVLKSYYSYIPGLNIEELLEVFPIFIERIGQGKERFLYELKGSTLIMGYEKVTDGFGQLISKIFKNWQHICELPCVKLSLYSQQELGVLEISELEDLFHQYIGENTRFILSWYKTSKASEQVYFLAEGNENTL